jgi:GTP-binding protein
LIHFFSLKVTFNDSPLKGNDGDKLTISRIKDRLIKESKDDVALRVDTEKATLESITISGRDDLHLGVFIQKMRREGFEMGISPPAELNKICEKTGEILEPIEFVNIEV